MCVPTLPDTFARGMSAQFFEDAKKKFTIAARREPENLKCLLVEYKLPFGHSSSLGQKPLMLGKDFLFGNFLTRVNAIHRSVHLFLDRRRVQTVENLQVFCNREPLGAAHRFQLCLDLVKAHCGKMSDSVQSANGFR